MSQTTRTALLALAVGFAAAAVVFVARAWIGGRTTDDYVDGRPERFVGPPRDFIGGPR